VYLQSPVIMSVLFDNTIWNIVSSQASKTVNTVVLHGLPPGVRRELGGLNIFFATLSRRHDRLPR
jgi:hypothetical protein